MDYLFLALILASAFASASYLRVKAITVVLFILVFAFWFVCNMFTGNGVTDAVYYHMKSNVHGTSIDDILPKIYAASAFILAAVVIIVAAAKLKKRIPNRNPVLFNIIFVLFCALNITQSHAIINIYNSIKNLSYGNGFDVAKNYNAIDFKTSKHYNYVFIYAESLERTLRDIDGVNYIPNISKLADNYLEFTNIEQIPGMGWTMAGMVNTQCAVPLVLPQGNSAGNMSHFLGGADCVATHLQKSNYTTEFIRGSDKEFAGGDKFFSQHGWEYQHDKGFFEKNNLASENNISGWGVHDDTLINHVFSEFERLSASQHNFLLSFLTVNTHPPAGTYLSTCDNHIPSDISNPMLKSAACSDYLLGQFIDKIIHSEYFDNTVIVLVSDHLMMANAASADLEKVQDQRRNNFIVIKKGIEPKKVDKAGTLLDVWPTLLTVSGATDTDFGFGHSLLGNAQSSILEAWREHANISDYLGFASHLWNYPSLNDPMSYKNDVLTIGQQQYNIPAFGIADKNKNIKGLYFEAFALNARRLTQEGDTLFYINRCEMTSGRSQGLCGYELTKDTTVQYEITEQGVANRRVVETTSPLYTQDLVAISSGPLNVQTGITDGKDEQLIPRGVTFYRLNGNQLSGGKVIDFDTCENKAVDTNTVKHLLGDGSTPLIFTSNDSAFCIPYETRPSINTVLRSDAATQLAPRQQVVGVYGDKETKFIIGKADKPLDVFINRDNFKLYPLCDIFSDCQ